MESVPGWTLVARTVRPQGRKGELLADLFTDFPDRFRRFPRVWLAPNGFSESELTSTTPSLEPVEVANYWLPVGRNLGRIVLHFAGVNTIEQAEKLVGKEVIVPTSERLPLEDGSVYLSDLIGCNVLDGDMPVGTVSEVQFATTPDGSRKLEDAAPLLVVAAPSGGEHLIPFVKTYIDRLDVAAKLLRMHLPEGLIELNGN